MMIGLMMMYKLVNGELKQFVLYKYSNFDGIVKKNNLITNGDFSIDTNADGLADNWNKSSRSTATLSSSGQKIQNDGAISQMSLNQTGIPFVNGNKYYVYFDIVMNKQADRHLVVQTFNGIGTDVYFYNSVANVTNIEVIFTSLGRNGFYVSLAGGSYDSTEYFIINNVKLLDLTLIYGAGNEPTTVAELKSDLFNRGKFMMYKYNSSLEKKGAF